ncbi:MAG: (Fe-S)-binding protein [Proteobacteria bacterium]|nr:(Fe-S)-binding protein [Pseudomonadota bacterium]
MEKNVSLFLPCSVNLLLPKVGASTRLLLNRLGCSTIYHDDQTCCGQMVLNKGFRDQAKGFARHFIRVFEKDEWIVCPSGSCVHMVRHHYPALFEAEPRWEKRARTVAAKVYELSEFIVDVLGRSDVGATFNGKVAYHESCHIHRALGITEQPKTLIRSVKGTHLTPMNQADQCCGFGGEFSLEFSDISGAMVGTKVRHFLDSGADLLVVGEPGCLLNITTYLSKHHPGKQALHFAEFLAKNGGDDGC